MIAFTRHRVRDDPVQSLAGIPDTCNNGGNMPLLIQTNEELNMKARHLLVSALLFAVNFQVLADAMPYEKRQAWWYALSPQQQQEIIQSGVATGKSAAQSTANWWNALSPEQQQSIINTHSTYATSRRQMMGNAWQNATPEQKATVQQNWRTVREKAAGIGQQRREARRGYQGSE